MPISDLLAEISGEKSSPAPAARQTATGSKRKADDQNDASVKLIKSRHPDGSSSASKIIRNGSGDVNEQSYSGSRPAASRPAIPRRTSPPPRTSSPATNGKSDRPAANGSRGTTPSANSNGRLSEKPSGSYTGSSSRLSAAKPSQNMTLSSLNRPKSAQAKPSPTTPTASDPSKAPPKKGSFAEIMARGAKAQQVYAKAGTIQHKSTEKRSTEAAGSKFGKLQMKERGQGADPRKQARSATKSKDSGKNGHGKAAASSRRDGKESGRSRPSSSGSDKAAEEKKVKKSALVSTGYTGTARPRPGATSGKSSSSGPRTAGGVLAPPRLGRRDRYEDEYDEELDDFIDYDEDEDDGGRGGGYGYASDGSSDMEAGMSDIDQEERRAERFARDEDRREEARLEQLRRDKEDRKRRLGGR